MDQVGSMANMESSVLRGPNTSSSLTNTVIMPWGSAYIKEDIVRIVTQWLADEGFGAARQALLEEAGLNLRESEDEKNEKWKLRTCLLGAYLTLTKEGNWAEVEKICAKPFFKGHKAFLYAIYRQQFLEIIEHREYQKVCSTCSSSGIYIPHKASQTAGTLPASCSRVWGPVLFTIGQERDRCTFLPDVGRHSTGT